MSSQRFERRDERIETTITPKELTPSDLATYTIKSGKTQVPLDRLLTKQGQALNTQADELEKKDDELKEIKKDLKEEKDANTVLKKRIKEMNKELEKYKSDLDTIDQEKKYVGDKNKELTNEKKRLEAVVTSMSKKDKNIEDIRDTYERSLQEHRNRITRLEKELEKESKDNYGDIRKQLTEGFYKRDKIIEERERTIEAQIRTITKLRGIVEKNIKELGELNQSSLSRNTQATAQLQSFTTQIEMERKKNFHLKEAEDAAIRNFNLALKARDLANTSLQKVIREYQTYRREAESYRREAESYKTQTDIEKRELINNKKQAESNARKWREQLEATTGGNQYKKPFNDGYKKGLVDGKKNVNQDLINQIDNLKKEKSDLRSDLDEALARELQWGTTMETIKTAKVAKKTKDANLNTNNPESNYNITSGTRRTRTTRQPSTLLPRAEQVEQARVIGRRTVVAQEAAVAPANQTGLRGRLGRLSGLLGRRTRALAPGQHPLGVRRGTARVVADAPGGASNKNKTKKNKGKKSRKERKKKNQMKKR